jgi:2,3-bisphosphoglycerate-independent phosphoglycerate mutase
LIGRFARLPELMKYALIIPDGAADERQDSLGGRTPLEAAHTPHMDGVAQTGLIGQADHVPVSMPSGSDVGTMSLFGYDPQRYHTGRAPIEAAAQGIELGPLDWAIRCNLVNVTDGRMRSFTAAQIPSDLARELVQLLQKDQCGTPTWKFHPGVSYRNLLIYRSRGEAAPFGRATKTTPPHDIPDQFVADFLPQGPGSAELRALMDRSVAVLAGSARNQQRTGPGELPATQIWLWGQGKSPELEPFKKRFGKTAAVITAVDLLRGLGRLLGWKIVDVPGATGYVDTDYAAKGRYAIEALRDVDLVVVHVEASDEASHEGDAGKKVEVLERIDADIVGPIQQFLQSQGDYRLLICPDHPTFLRTKTHSHGPVPFALCGTGVTRDTATDYNEFAAGRSSISLPGYELMPFFLGAPKVGS